MFALNLTIKSKSDKILELSLSHIFRILFFLITAMLLYVLTLDSPGGNEGSNIGPIIVITICVLGGLYNESWRFDKEKKIVKYNIGLLLFSLSRQIDMDNIESVNLSEFIKGSSNIALQEKKHFFQIKYTKLSLILKNGSSKTLEIVSSKKRVRLEQNGQQIADFCSKPYIESNSPIH